MGVAKPTAKGGLGEKLLRKFGWRDGDGLGVGRAGIADPIEVTKKQNNGGVSGEEGGGG